MYGSYRRHHSVFKWRFRRKDLDMEQPTGLNSNNSNDMVFIHKKSFYGLKQASCMWNI